MLLDSISLFQKVLPDFVFVRQHLSFLVLFEHFSFFEVVIQIEDGFRSPWMIVDFKLVSHAHATMRYLLFGPRRDGQYWACIFAVIRGLAYTYVVH